MSQLALSLTPRAAPAARPGWVPPLRGLAWFRDPDKGNRWAAMLVLSVAGTRVTGAVRVGRRTLELADLHPRPPGLCGGRRG